MVYFSWAMSQEKECGYDDNKSRISLTKNPRGTESNKAAHRHTIRELLNERELLYYVTFRALYNPFIRPALRNSALAAVVKGKEPSWMAIILVYERRRGWIYTVIYRLHVIIMSKQVIERKNKKLNGSSK